MKRKIGLLPLFLAIFCIGGCSANKTVREGPLRVTAVETYLADIAQNVAGDQFTVATLLPYGTDPHGFQPAPQDIARVADSDILIVNGSGMEGWLDEALAAAGNKAAIVSASSGLQTRRPQLTEKNGESANWGIDPHFYLDPVLVEAYAANIREAFIARDPEHADLYRKNALAYMESLRLLDGWVQNSVAALPMIKRMLVTNHDSLGYFADQYGFTVVGNLIPSAESNAAPSAQQFAQLIQIIRFYDVSAVFLEVGTNADLANQLASETGVQVVSGLYIHSLTPPGGVASTYLDMIRYDVRLILAALKAKP